MSNESTSIKTRTRQDLIFVGVAVLVLCFGVASDPDRVFEWVAQRRAVQLDEFLVAIVIIGTGFAVFSWRRWTDLSRQIAEYQRLQAELTAINRDSALLSETDDLLQSCLSVQEAYKIVIRHIESQFPAWSGAIATISTNRDTVEMVARWGNPTIAEEVFPSEDCWSLRRGRLNIAAVADGSLLCAHIGPRPPSYAVCIPMIAQGETIGILYLDTGKESSADSRTTAALSESQERIIKTLAEHLALTLASLNLREKLKMQAIRDPLTELFNRRYMEESVERELRRSARRDLPLTVLLVDVDHFKQFNDTYGHEAGDFLLQNLATTFRANLRAEDIACRHGGEEFMLILTETPLAFGMDRADALRQKVAQLRLNYRGSTLPQVTISIGVACYPADGDSIDSLLRAADRALYEAKGNGRDRVVAAGPPVVPGGLDDLQGSTLKF